MMEQLVQNMMRSMGLEPEEFKQLIVTTREDFHQIREDQETTLRVLMEMNGRLERIETKLGIPLPHLKLVEADDDQKEIENG